MLTERNNTESSSGTELSSSGASRAFTFKVTTGVIVIAIAVWFLGLVVLPVLDVKNAGIDSWNAICRAIGIGSPAPPQSSAPSSPASTWAPAPVGAVAGDPVKGEALAKDSCIGCHDANGLSADPAAIPSITGLSARAITKQLQDMRHGQRQNEVMAPLVADLTDAQVADLAAYYSRLPRRNHDIRVLQTVAPEAVRLATKGDATRALPACDSCHGATSGGPLEAPTLVGQYPGYISAQLKAYASGARANDIYGRMRRIAGKLTDQEIAEIAAYYDAKP